MSTPFDTFETADARLKAWASEVVGDVAVSLGPPAAPGGTPGVGLYLLDLVEAPPPRGSRDAPLRVALRYLVTTWADAPAEEHRLLGALLFAAMAAPWLDVELEAFPSSLWSSFGVAPRPSFLLRVFAQQERETRPVKLVLRHVVKRATMAPLVGRVLGPGDVPLPQATVTLPSLALSTVTDASGAFRFAAVPPEPRHKRLQVVAKGVVVVADVDVGPAVGGPAGDIGPGGDALAGALLTIRVPITEG